MKFRADRFRKLIEAVKKAPADRFDMALWRSRCETAACAVGHYCMANQNSDLVLVKDIGERLIPALLSDRRCVETEAVSRHFGIAMDDTCTLFLGSHYKRSTKRSVLYRLKSFYASKTKGKK